MNPYCFNIHIKNTIYYPVKEVEFMTDKETKNIEKFTLVIGVGMFEQELIIHLSKKTKSESR